MARVYIDNDAEWWRDALQKICIIAECVDVFWDSKAFFPRLKDSKKRGAEALKEFKKHFIMMKGMGIEEIHLDAFVEIVRCWRKVRCGKERAYNPKWLDVLWGKFLRVPPNSEDDLKEIMIKYFRNSGEVLPIKVVEEDNIIPPQAYNFEPLIDVEVLNYPHSIPPQSDEDGRTSTFCGTYVDLGGNHIMGDYPPTPPDPTKIEAITLLIKSLELSKTDKIHLIHSVLSLM